jgi:hypothetical protein
VVCVLHKSDPSVAQESFLWTGMVVFKSEDLVYVLDGCVRPFGGKGPAVRRFDRVKQGNGVVLQRHQVSFLTRKGVE